MTTSIPAPEGWPKGYSWSQFSKYDYTLERLNEYIKESTFTTSTEEIVSYMNEFFQRFPEAKNTPAGWVSQYILEHPEIHHLLKHVGDGSWRKNRILLQQDPIFDNHNYERFLESLTTDHVVFTEDPETPEEAIELLKEIIQEDEVIFVQYYEDYDPEDDNFMDYDDPDYTDPCWSEDETSEYNQYWDDGCPLEDT
jgi:hypothetical protein